MERIHCPTGQALEKTYVQLYRKCEQAEGKVQAAMQANSEEKLTPALEQSALAEGLRNEAQRAYIDHVLSCRVCKTTWSEPKH